MNSFVKRRIEVTINFGTGQYGDTPGESMTLSGHRIRASIVHRGYEAQGEAHIRIYGLPLEMMNRLTGTGPRASEIRRNSILIAAGDEGGPMSVAYQGMIRYAFGDFNSAPEVFFNIVALGSAVDAVKPVAARSYVGEADAANIIADLAKDMNAPDGLVFENSSGASAILRNCYLPGTNLQQLKACAAAARFSYTIERGKLAIYPYGGCRNDRAPIRIALDSGLAGYPVFGGQGIFVRSLYNPEVELGRRIEVFSEIQAACGVWKVFNVAHELESEVPNGQWFTQMDCSRQNDE